MDQRRWRVLLVDGDEARAERLRRLLSGPGCDLDQVGNCTSVLAALDAGGYDACLVADRLGPCDGLDVVRTAQARGCLAAVILLADAADPERDQAALDGGAAACLVLGETDAPLLERTLRAAVARRRAEADLRQANAVLRDLVRDLEQRAYQNTVLAEMANLLQTCQTTEQACAVITACAARLFPGEAGGLFLLRGEPARLGLVSVWGDPCLRSGKFLPHECRGLRLEPGEAGRRPAPPCEHLGRPLPAASLCLPLLTQGEALGVLHVQAGHPAADQTGAFVPLLPEAQEGLAQAVADHAALALANLQLRQSLREQATRDPLTNLFNRRHMEESLERELRRAERRRAPLGILMLDLDHFKRCNDTFGHEAGDALLRAAGHFLQTHIRGEDLACRYGGEEFLLILTDSSLQDTCKRAEELREGIKALDVRHRGVTLGPVSASLGVAVFPEHGVTADALVRAADAALYQAKAEGRDRVVVAQPPALAGPHFPHIVPAAPLRAG
jgi:diguanylate cyclase (GGDEF)-like protein